MKEDVLRLLELERSGQRRSLHAPAAGGRQARRAGVFSGILNRYLQIFTQVENNKIINNMF